MAEKSRHQLALAGKLMGLCGYGKPIEKHVPAFHEFFFDRDYRKLAFLTKLPLKNIDVMGIDSLLIFLIAFK